MTSPPAGAAESVGANLVFARSGSARWHRLPACAGQARCLSHPDAGRSDPLTAPRVGGMIRHSRCQPAQVARVAESADAPDSKSGRDLPPVRVRVPPLAPFPVALRVDGEGMSRRERGEWGVVGQRRAGRVVPERFLEGSCAPTTDRNSMTLCGRAASRSRISWRARRRVPCRACCSSTATLDHTERGGSPERPGRVWALLRGRRAPQIRAGREPPQDRQPPSHTSLSSAPR